MEKFLKPCKEFSDFYWDKGYAIIEKLLNFNDLENIFVAYEKIKKSQAQYFAMTTQNMSTIELNNNGFIKDPIGDVAICDFINADMKEFAFSSKITIFRKNC